MDMEGAMQARFDAWDALSPEEQRQHLLGMIKDRWAGDKPDFMPTATHECDLRDIKALFAEIERLQAIAAHSEALKDQAFAMLDRVVCRSGPDIAAAIVEAEEKAYEQGLADGLTRARDQNDESGLIPTRQRCSKLVPLLLGKFSTADTVVLVRDIKMELPGYHPKAIANALGYLVRRGELQRVKYGVYRRPNGGMIDDSVRSK